MQNFSPNNYYIAAAIVAASLVSNSHFAQAGCRDNAAPNVNWTKCSKERMVLSGRNLQKAVFKNAYMAGTSFRTSDLRNANFEGAELTRASFRGAKLQGAKFSRAYGSRTGFSKADLSGGMLSKAELQRSNFSKANLTKA